MDSDDDELQGLMNAGSEEGSDIELDLIWNNDQQYIRQQPLEPCGLGGVRADDHFRLVVDTKRPKQDILQWSSEPQSGKPNESREGIIYRGAAMLVSCPVLSGSEAKTIEEPLSDRIEYLSWCIERLTPVPLPYFARSFPPLSTYYSTSSEDDDPSLGQ
jgi:hypothetical protein